MDYIKTIIGLFVIVDPLGVVPIFISMTAGHSRSDKRAIAKTATLTASGVLAGAALTGQHLLDFFGVSIPAFRVAGGVLLLLIAISMLNAQRPRTKHTPEEAAEAAEKDSIAVVPLAIPLLAGPGAISSTILYASQARSWFDYVFLVLACALVGASTYLACILSEPIGRILGKTGINIVTRLFGILLAAIGVEFITRGLVQLIPSLGH